MWRRIHYRTENRCVRGFTAGQGMVVEEDSFTAGQGTVAEEDSLQEGNSSGRGFTAGQETVVEEDSLQDREQL